MSGSEWTGGPPVEVLVLGPVAVRRDDRLVEPSAPLVAGVLGALALAGEGALSVQAMAGALWPNNGEARKRSTVAVVVHRARRWLHNVAGDGATIEFGAGGYRLAGVEVDARRFTELVAAGQVAGALRLWRGEPLAGAFLGPSLDMAIESLARARLSAVVRHARSLLGSGRAVAAVEVLAPLVDAHPLDEPVQAVWIEALAGAGRQAEAVQAHERLRHRLAEELGVDPGPEVQTALTRVLRQELPAPGRDPTVPAQLPADLRTFVGRAAQLELLDRMLDGDGRAVGPIVISAIGGSAGVGKTALAVHWAHRRRDRFPDGQLYVNLHGFGTLPPVPPGSALDQFLRALGVPADQVPPDLAARTALFRSRLADRRVLVLMDNARDAEQIRPLLPGGGQSLALVTSRSELRGLAVRDGALPIAVDQLSVAEALALLSRYVGADRVAQDPDGAQAIIRHCARLPLALSIVADRAAREPGRRLGELAAELAADRDRLAALAAGDDPSSDVRAVFSWSYQALAPAAARLFRLLGLHPGPDTDPRAAAALAGVDVTEAGHLLATLAAGHLLEQRHPGRYELHDLLRAYAAQLVTEQDPESDRAAALNRLIDHYVHATAAAMDLVVPQERTRRPKPAGSAHAVPDFVDTDEADGWLDAERPNLLAMASYAAGHGKPGQVVLLSEILHRYLRERTRFDDAAELHRHAVRAARQSGDAGAESYALNCLATVYRRTGRLAEAERAATEAIAAARRAGDLQREEQALSNLGMAAEGLGNWTEAVDHFGAALTIARKLGDRDDELRIANAMGIMSGRLGRLSDAERYFRQTLDLLEDSRDPAHRARVLNNLGALRRMAGDAEDARRCHEEALTIARTAGSLVAEGNALAGLGQVERLSGRYPDAMRSLAEALEVARRIDEPALEVEVLVARGETMRVSGDARAALDHCRQALTLADRIGLPYWQARAHDGLGDAYRELGDPGAGDRHWREALARYRELGAPEADDLETRMAEAAGR